MWETGGSERHEGEINAIKILMVLITSFKKYTISAELYLIVANFTGYPVLIYSYTDLNFSSSVTV